MEPDLAAIWPQQPLNAVRRTGASYAKAQTTA
jgi:hypothetical protein